MNKININSSKTQSMTAEEINQLATYILDRKGDVDMSSCDVTITPPSGMNANMAGIIVKCAKEHGGIVNISGATEIDDDEWAIAKEYGCPAWMVQIYEQQGISLLTLIEEWANYAAMKKLYTELNYIEAPQATTIQCYINTGIKNNIGVGAIIKGYYTRDYNISLVGYINSYGVLTTYSNYIGFGYGSIGWFAGRICNGGDVYYSLLCKDGTLYYDVEENNSVLQSSSASISETSEYNSDLYLFGGQNNNYPNQGQSRIYWCQIYEGNKLVRDFVPCYRNVDNMLGLYDLVEGKFYSNTGDGTFNAGDVSVHSLQERYLELYPAK